MSTMIATRTVYPVGYSTLGSQEYIEGLMSSRQTLLIDTRISPKSWNAEWCKDALQAKYGDRYRWAGRYLGNTALGTGRIEIANPAVGIKGLITYLNEGHDLILLCQCRQFLNCHMSQIVSLLQGKMPTIEIVQQQPDTIPCLSIKQPWAWLIANGLKDIENRDWSTNYRGPLLIHAGKAFDKDCFIGSTIDLDLFNRFGIEVFDALPRYKTDYALGCIIGQADLVDVVEKSDSRWFCGDYGFALENAQTIDPIPYAGKLKLFDVPRDVIQVALICAPEGQEEALAVETDAEEVVDTSPPDLVPDNNTEDNKAIHNHCVVCGELATVASPSGREDSIYCKTHGHCLRCGASVEQFIKHPYISNYVCNCVVEFEIQLQRNEDLKQAKPVAFSF